MTHSSSGVKSFFFFFPYCDNNTSDCLSIYSCMIHLDYRSRRRKSIVSLTSQAYRNGDGWSSRRRPAYLMDFFYVLNLLHGQNISTITKNLMYHHLLLRPPPSPHHHYRLIHRWLQQQWHFMLLAYIPSSTYPRIIIISSSLWWVWPCQRRRQKMKARVR